MRIPLVAISTTTLPHAGVVGVAHRVRARCDGATTLRKGTIGEVEVDKSSGENEWYWMALGFAVILGAAMLSAGTNDSGDQSNNGVFITIGVIVLTVAVAGFLLLARSVDWSKDSSKIGIGAFALVSIGAVILSIGDGAMSTLGYAIAGGGVGLMVATYLADRKEKRAVT